MWFFHLAFMAIATTVATADVSCDSLNVTIFKDETDSFEVKIQKSLQITKNVFATDEMKKAVEISAVVPGLSELSSALTLLAGVLSSESGWQANFLNTISSEADRPIARQAAVDIRAYLRTINNTFALLDTPCNDDSMCNKKTHVANIENNLSIIIEKLADRNTIFRKYALLAMPLMFTTASYVKIWAIYGEIYDEFLFNNTRVFCRLKRVLSEYRSRAVFQRLKILERTDKSSAKTTLEGYMYEFLGGDSSDSFHQSQPGQIRSKGTVECEIGCETSKMITYDDKCIEDPIDSRRLFAGRHEQLNRCIVSYAECIKTRVESPFHDTIAMLESYCGIRSKKIKTNEHNGTIYGFFKNNIIVNILMHFTLE